MPQISISPEPSVVCQGGTEAAGKRVNVSGGTGGASKPPFISESVEVSQGAASTGDATAKVPSSSEGRVTESRAIRRTRIGLRSCGGIRPTEREGPA